MSLHTHTRLMAVCPWLLVWAGTRKVKPISILQKQETVQVFTSPQTGNHASTIPLSFIRPDALPVAQPTVSKQWRYHELTNIEINYLYAVLLSCHTTFCVCEKNFCFLFFCTAVCVFAAYSWRNSTYRSTWTNVKVWENMRSHPWCYISRTLLQG